MRKNKFTQRNTAAGSTMPASLDQKPKYANVGSTEGDKLASNAESMKRKKIEYIGKKKTPDGKFYTPASFAYAVKAGVIKP